MLTNPLQEAISVSHQPSPEIRKPRQRQQLWFDDLEKPLNEEKAGCVSTNNSNRASEPMARADDRHGG
jgi:hypothetical protein